MTRVWTVDGLTFDDIEAWYDIANGINERVEVVPGNDVLKIPITHYVRQSDVAKAISTLETIAPFYVNTEVFAEGSTDLTYWTFDDLKESIGGEFPILNTGANDVDEKVVRHMAVLKREWLVWMYSALQKLTTTAHTDWILRNVQAKKTTQSWGIAPPFNSWPASYAEAAANWPSFWTNETDSDDEDFLGWSTTAWLGYQCEEWENGMGHWNKIGGISWFVGGTSWPLGQIPNFTWLMRKRGKFSFENLSEHRPHTAEFFVKATRFIPHGWEDSAEQFVDIAGINVEFLKYTKVQDMPEDTTATRLTKRIDSNGGVPPYLPPPNNSPVWRGRYTVGFVIREAALLTTWNFET